MLTETGVLIIISCVGFAVLSIAVLVLRGTVKAQDTLLLTAMNQVREFVLSSMAYKASAEIHPMTGPAVLQQLGKVNNKSQLVPKNDAIDTGPSKTGVTVRQGANR